MLCAACLSDIVQAKKFGDSQPEKMRYAADALAHLDMNVCAKRAVICLLVLTVCFPKSAESLRTLNRYDRTLPAGKDPEAAVVK